ncbi:exodeoxyribonuclease V subunit alpha [Rhodococcus sp. SRB_17]|uniref:exodeoxyribonuclease V subunit alpha n=1 Tax=Acidovorax sp. SRB_24 TaxID=1962700 RepID=UPI00145F145B|nr:exodeoxyribonuclease V subunit alpha [Acidovorax sp. SRB_24]NMM77153.1 exodeoxyribonuclease V subunit alpha [Acidovorax sp. SRB_24]NMM88895.1 exodeoxyribonuclease V subunit alpha [Rhodococcus sp. SRB_17]
MNARKDPFSLPLFAEWETAAAPAPAPAATAPDTLDTLRQWSDAGWLRQLDSALAAFIADLDPQAPPALLVATALLAHMEGRGHSCLPLAPLVAHPGAVLGWPAEAQDALAALWAGLPERLADWRAALRGSPVVWAGGPDTDTGQPLVLSGTASAPRLYLRRYWGYERAVAQQILERTATPLAVDAAAVRGWLDRLFAPAAATGSVPGGAGAVDWQKLACAMALRGRLSVITGGPGTGKTYTAARLLALLFAVDAEPERLRVALAAPTGKAAARLKQAIDAALAELHARVGAELDLPALTQRMGAARTLHALLGARPDTREFRHHAAQPLDVDVLIVDEASMVHLEMMAALLAALPPSARVVFLGDKDQLASVEAGAVLGDLCRDAQAGRYSEESACYALAAAGEALPATYLDDTGTPPPLAQHTVMLRESRRFGGPIGQLALAVNAGDVEVARHCLAHDASGTLRHLEGVAPAAVWQLAVQGRSGAASYRAYLEQLAQRPACADAAAHADWVQAVLAAFERFRLLCAVREGEWGAAGLNRAVEAVLQATGLLAPRGEWYAGRPVMVTRNDPALGVFNGDIGIALPAAARPAHEAGAAPGLRVYFADGPQLRSVGVGRLAHVETAFAMTVHKSQGSEFEHTVLVLPPHAGAVLSRELVYTGITRARQAFTLVSAQPGLLAAAVQQRTQRASGLQDWLAHGLGAS